MQASSSSLKSFVHDAPHKSVFLAEAIPQGRAVAHFLEKDESLHEEPYGTLLVLQPAAALRNNAHYVVAVRRLATSVTSALATSAGKLATPSQYFARLRNGKPSGQGETERSRLFERDVFPSIADIGWQREELQLAWDFRTSSWQSGPGVRGHNLSSLSGISRALENEYASSDMFFGHIVCCMLVSQEWAHAVTTRTLDASDSKHHACKHAQPVFKSLLVSKSNNAAPSLSGSYWYSCMHA
jgi:hypothetical protein